MTAQDLLHLCGFTYIDLPAHYTALLERGGRVPLAEAARGMLGMDALGVSLCEALTQGEIGHLQALQSSELDIIAYVNSNKGSGFVGYAFETAGGERIVSMRGSERRGPCVPNNIDWRDNFCAPFQGSVQYAEALAFVNRFAEGALIITGHSKGAHNALYALSGAINPAAKSMVFNGQGFSRPLLTGQQIARLKADGLNYVVSGDIVGSLLYHPERRKFVKYAENGANPHALEAYAFDAQGNPVPCRRPLQSVAIEVGSRLAVHFYGANPPRWLLSAVALVFGEPPGCVSGGQGASSLSIPDRVLCGAQPDSALDTRRKNVQ